ncbi:MAG: TIGR02186 family protein [Rhizobiaceae bacterium]
MNRLSAPHRSPAGLVCRLILAFTFIAALGEHARAQSQPTRRLPEQIQMGLSTDVIPVTSEFSGTSLAVFGTIENADKLAQTFSEYAIVVTITGPSQEVVVRRKERVAGIWMNRQNRTYRGVPSFYALASNRALAAVAPEEELKKAQLGVDRLSLNLFSGGATTFIQPAPEFASSLRRIRKQKSLYTEDANGVTFLGSSLFRATLAVPSNVPIGTHKVTAYLFRHGELLSSRSASVRVEKAGFEQLMYTLAHEYSFWYGIIAVLAALFTGWLASVVFGGTRK